MPSHVPTTRSAIAALLVERLTLLEEQRRRHTEAAAERIAEIDSILAVVQLRSPRVFAAAQRLATQRTSRRRRATFGVVTIDILGVSNLQARLGAIAQNSQGMRILANELVAELARGRDERAPRGRGGRRGKRTRQTRSWPYDSGRSRREFYAEVQGNQILIRNRARNRGFNYPVAVEEGRPSSLTRGSARRQLQRELPRIVEDVEIQLARFFDDG